MPSRSVVVVRSGERLAAVDVMGLAGEEGVRRGEQDALRDVLGSADAPGGIAGAGLSEVVRAIARVSPLPRPTTSTVWSVRDGIGFLLCCGRVQSL
jgi:hypothetical protein